MNTFDGSGQVKFAPGKDDTGAQVAADIGGGTPSFTAGKGDQDGAQFATPEQRRATMHGSQILAVDAYFDATGTNVRLTWSDGGDYGVVFRMDWFRAYCLADKYTRRRMVEEHARVRSEEEAAEFRAYIDSIQGALDRLCLTRIATPRDDFAARVRAQFGDGAAALQTDRYTPVYGHVPVDPSWVGIVDRGSVIQINLFRSPRTLYRRDFLSQYCGLSAEERVYWVGRLFGVVEATPPYAIDLATRGAIRDHIVPQLDRLCYARATEPDPPRLLNPLGRPAYATGPSGQVGTPPPADAGLPEWAKYLIGGVVGAGVGYGIFTLTSEHPRANRRR